MVVTEYNKLVRDNIPQIIEASGKKPTWYELGDKDFLTALQCKVTEEIKELMEAKTYKDQIEECADLLTVFFQYMDHFNLEADEVLIKALEKNMTHGLFHRKIFLQSVEDYR